MCDGAARVCAWSQEPRVLEFAWWLVAWRRYSITAAVTNQMQFGQTVAHEAVVAEVVALGAADGYGPAIGPLYSDHERSSAPFPLCALGMQPAPREGTNGRSYRADHRHSQSTREYAAHGAHRACMISAARACTRSTPFKNPSCAGRKPHTERSSVRHY